MFLLIPAAHAHSFIRMPHLQELVNIMNILHNDHHFTQDLKEKTNQAVQDTIIATRIVDGHRNQQTSGAYLKDHAGFPLELVSVSSSS